MPQDNFIGSVQQLLRSTILQQRALAKNIANQNTPGYHREEVDFNQVLQNLKANENVHLLETNREHISTNSQAADVVEVKKSSEPIPQGKINNVDLDNEMSNMAKTQLYYEMLARVMRNRFQNLRSVITGKTS